MKGEAQPGNRAAFFRNLPCRGRQCHSCREIMPRSTRTGRARRAPRVKLSGTVLALLRLDNGREVRARLHQLSFTGGLLHLDKPMDEGVKVEVMFHIGDSTIRNRAVMLFPMWA